MKYFHFHRVVLQVQLIHSIYKSLYTHTLLSCSWKRSDTYLWQFTLFLLFWAAYDVTLWPYVLAAWKIIHPLPGEDVTKLWTRSLFSGSLFSLNVEELKKRSRLARLKLPVTYNAPLRVTGSSSNAGPSDHLFTYNLIPRPFHFVFYCGQFGKSNTTSDACLTGCSAPTYPEMSTPKFICTCFTLSLLPALLFVYLILLFACQQSWTLASGMALWRNDCVCAALSVATSLGSVSEYKHTFEPWDTHLKLQGLCLLLLEIPASLHTWVAASCQC